MIWGDEAEEEEENDQKQTKHIEDDDSDNEKKRVRSPKEKLQDLIREKYKKIRRERYADIGLEKQEGREAGGVERRDADLARGSETVVWHEQRQSADSWR